MKRYILVVLGGALVSVSVAVNVLQAIRIGSLEREQEKTAGINASAIGRPAPWIPAHNLDGSPAAIRFVNASRPTVIYIFRPSCVWCNRNSGVFNSFASRLAGRYTVVGLSLDSANLPAYIKAHGMSVPVYSDPDPAVVARYRLGVTPETLVISAAGTILQDWRGAYTGETGTLLEHFFGFRLADNAGAGNRGTKALDLAGE